MNVGKAPHCFVAYGQLLPAIMTSVYLEYTARSYKKVTDCTPNTIMRFFQSARLSLLLLLPVALIGCGSNNTPTETAATNTASATTADSTATGNSATTSSAKVTVVGDTGLQLSLPAKWTTENNKEDVSCYSPDSGAAVTFFPVKDDATAKRVIAALLGAKAKNKNYKQDGPPASSQIGALEATEQTGSYDLKDGPYTWKIDTVKGKSIVVINSIFDGSAQNTADSKALLDSIKTTP